MNKLLKVYGKFGGHLLIKQWIKAGIFFNTLSMAALLGFSKKGLEILRLAIQYKTQLKLKKRYNYILQDSKKNSYDLLVKNQSDKVWVCWLQGMDNAPLLVQRCYSSIQENLINKEIIVVTSENLNKYVEFPLFIIEKWKKGIITNTHFSDLLRLEILIKHGGLWVDSTVLCTGNNIPEYILNSDLFFYQILKPGRDGHSIGLSSWLISSKSNSKVLLITRDLLYEYWKKNNFLIDYFLLHTFMEIVLDYYPEERNKVIKVCNSTPHILLLDIFKQYDKIKYGYIQEMSCFHKLSYKHSEEDIKKTNTYYDIIVNQGKWKIDN
ncbi:capsular polysaccharide synthesis protein [Saccharicrinis sp. 156]|uniref:capsular polysaccharide synthesis protein n=1 Tax=Saccharicrinis sp. 156 TaxID=3417574 RepID=UPI003D33796D